MICIHEIQLAVSDACGVTRLDLLSRRRAREVARPRQVGMWLARRLTRASLPEIGHAFGGRDHTTVMHAVEVIDREIAQRTRVGTMALQLRDALRGETKQ